MSEAESAYRDGQYALDKAREVAGILGSAGIDGAEREGEEIVCSVLHIERTVLYRDNPVIDNVHLSAIDALVKRRIVREPLQYIYGEVEFYGLKIRVGKGVLIPRPETELLVDEAVRRLSRMGCRLSVLKILDLCCGSGCIALSLARAFPMGEIYGTDISEEALRYALGNARLNGIENATFLKGHLFEPVEGMKFSLIISNPPYIKRKDIPGLQPEIRLHEPIEALDGGEDGMDFHRKILSRAGDFLDQDGSVMVEMGDGQTDGIKAIAQSAGFHEITLQRDYAGKERIAVIGK